MEKRLIIGGQNKRGSDNSTKKYLKIVIFNHFYLENQFILDAKISILEKNKQREFKIRSDRGSTKILKSNFP